MNKNLKPCPKCGNEEIEDHDFGYSSFNCGYYKCKRCGFIVEWNWSSFIRKENWAKGIKNIWNQEAYDYPIRKRAFKKLTKLEKIVLGFDNEKIRELKNGETHKHKRPTT